MKYEVSLDWIESVKAESKEEAIEKFVQKYFDNEEDMEDFLAEALEVEEAKEE